MTTQDSTNTTTDNNNNNNGAANPALDAIRAEQWQAFVNNMAQQNAALANELTQTRNALTETAVRQHQENLSKLTPEQKAEALEAELNNIRSAANQAYQNQVSQDVWRRRDAEAAARILRLANLNVNHPELYRGDWDQNWMPRFVASVEGIQSKRSSTNTADSNPRDNPGNRANVGTSMGSTVPELDDKADGPSTIRFALQRLAEGRT
jgi:hypothetical protein